MSKIPLGGNNGGGQDDEDAGSSGTNGAGDGGAAGAADAARSDPGTFTVEDFIATGLADLGNPDGGLLARLCVDEAECRVDDEGFRIETERAGHLVRLFGLDVSRAYRVELREKRRLLEDRRRLLGERRKLIDKLFRVAEVDLPPEEP